MLALSFIYACQVNFWTGSSEENNALDIKVERFDRLQTRYLTTGDFSALQSMNTTYPIETRTLIENVLQLGTVDQHDINERFLKFYQDTTLQNIITASGVEYSNMDDINASLSKAFTRLQKDLPDMAIPTVYAQIGALSQSIIVGEGTVGICLDKYLGKDFAPYLRFYPEQQRVSMTREHIVPDCLTFYILSIYPLVNFETASQEVRDEHIGRVMYAVNKAVGKQFYKTPYVKKVGKLMRSNPKLTIKQLLSNS